jgi:hypothetical protein
VAHPSTGGEWELQTEATPNLSGPHLIARDLAEVEPGGHPSSSQAVGLLAVSPALFVENRGQWHDPSVRYVLDGASVDVVVTDSGVLFQATKKDPGKAEGLRDPVTWEPGLRPGRDAAVQTLQFSASFVGANRVRPVGLKRSESLFHYCVGDHADWRQNVPSYEVVAYESLYEGIDLHIRGLRNHLKYEFHVAPGANYHQIAIYCDGVDGLSIGEDGSLRVDLGGGWGMIRDDAPYIYQEIDGRKVEVTGRFTLVDDRTYSFEITGEIDPDHVLVIDPDLAWSTYLGASGDDLGRGIAVDASGNVLVTGRGSGDAFVTKLSSSGVHLWSTYLGGGGVDWGSGIAVDASGGVYVMGYTQSDGWTSGGFDTTYNDSYHSDAFVAALSSSGEHLWSTYLGGSDTDSGWGIAVDASGAVYVTGDTLSSGWTSGGFDTTHNGSTDAFVAKIMGTYVLHDWNGDGIASIVGDVPPFVQCVYFGNCPPDAPVVGDCNHDSIISIVGDVPCFVDCVYFGECPE